MHARHRAPLAETMGCPCAWGWSPWSQGRLGLRRTSQAWVPCTYKCGYCLPHGGSKLEKGS